MPRLSIRFHFDKRRGEVREFVIDDGDRTAPDDYHEAIARQVAYQLVPTALIREVREHVTADPEAVHEPASERERRKRGEGES